MLKYMISNMLGYSKRKKPKETILCHLKQDASRVEGGNYI